MKKERGAITILTLVTILFIISFLVSTFVIITNRRQAQAEIKKKTQEIYESDIGQEEQIYKSYFANENEVIPIYTAEQLFKVGTDDLIVSDNKIFKCTADADYKLASNIVFNVNDYLEEYPNNFEDSISWINIEENDKLTGAFDYNGNEILETDANGNEIKHPNTVKYIEYIESTGTQYIDTGIPPDNNTTFELRIALNDLSTTQAIMGARVGITNLAYNLFYDINENDLRWDYNTDQTSPALSYNVGDRINIVKTSTQITFEVNGKTSTITDGTATFSTPYNMYIFNINKAGELDGRYAKMKLYYLKIYERGTLVRDFVPALDTNSVACLYDKVTGEYFHNLGSGTFNYQ